MEYKIVIDDVIKYIDQIQMLGDQHKKSLGFFPEGAFQENAQMHQIYCAIENDHVIAYVMFRFNKRGNCVVLTHVCVDSGKRNNGIAHQLIDEVARNFPNASYMEVRCRRDYHLEKFWQACGFHVNSEKDGRKLAGSDLTIWHKRLCNSNLIDILLREEKKKDKIFAALDLNVLIHLCDEPESVDQCLFDSKIQGDVRYCVTPECKNEINKKDDAVIRRRHLEYASIFYLMDEVELDNAFLSELELAIDPNKMHLSDVKHLAYCITSDIVDAFITHDNWILTQKEYMANKYDLMIFSPEEFFSYIFSYGDYRIDRKITGSKYQLRELDNSTICDGFSLYQAAKMRKLIWEDEVRKYLVDDSITTWLIYDDDKIIGLISIKDNNAYFAICRLIVTISEERKVHRYLIISLLNKAIIHLAKKKGIILLYLTNNDNAAYMKAAIECGFIPFSSGLIKIIAPGTHKKKDILAAIEKHLLGLACPTEITTAIPTIIEYIQNIADRQEYALEKMLGPTLIIDLAIPTYIISIKPHYAVDLFDDDLANYNQSLLDNPHIYAALSMTNAYYTTSPLRFCTPCRIIWYVTQDYHYMDSGAVRASSIMFFHKRGTPQEVYKEFGQLGVLDWNKIRKLKVLSVFLFDSTVSFINPINVSDLRKLVAEIQDKKLQLQGPHHITDELSQRILITAMEETSCTI